MKKIKAAKKFLNANRIISLIAFIFFTVFGFVGLILLVAGLIDASEETAPLITNGLVYSIVFSIRSGLFMASMILSKIASNKLDTVKSKKESTGIGIMCMIAGYLSTPFGYAAGIMIFVTKDEEFKEIEVL